MEQRLGMFGVTKMFKLDNFQDYMVMVIANGIWTLRPGGLQVNVLYCFEVMW